MKKIKFIIYSLLVVLVFSSCRTYNAPTRYQGRALYKFNHVRRTYHTGKARALKPTNFKKQTAYRHPAVPDQVRRYLRARTWMEGVGEGALYE